MVKTMKTLFQSVNICQSYRHVLRTPRSVLRTYASNVTAQLKDHVFVDALCFADDDGDG